MEGILVLDFGYSDEGAPWVGAQIKASIQEAETREDLISHPLGFFRMRMGELSGGPLYLHVWIPDLSIRQEPILAIHAHSVSITSRVLLGVIEDVRYTWTEDAEGPQRLFAQDRSLPGSSLVRTERRGRATEESSTRFTAGQSYHVPYPVFHETRVPSDVLTATVCNFVGASENLPLVVAAEELQRPTMYIPTALDGLKKRLVIDQIVERLGSEATDKIEW